MEFDKIKKVHFIGIGGIGLSAIARLMKEKGKTVSGSDLGSSLIIKKLEEIGIKISIGQSEKNITEDLDLVVYTMAVPNENPELSKARRLNIKTISYPESLGMVFNDKFGIAICGTHGKSTTTAISGLLLDDAGLDPTVLVGSIVPKFESNLRTGKSEYIVIEACEYERAFLNYYPRILVINNIELDHTDYYKDIDDFRSAFEEFAGHLPEDGVLIANGDDGEISKLKTQISKQLQNLSIKIVNFGFGEDNDVKGYDVKTEEGKTKFKVSFKGKDLGEFVLKVPGEFNVRNALAAIALGIELNIPAEKIKKSLSNYSGIWRRFEIKGDYKPVASPIELWRGKSALIISDYAHHPTAVKLTIEAAKKFYPGRRIFAVFQPHQHNRTKKLYNDFLKSFDSADALVLVEIFDVAGREEERDQNVSSKVLAEDVKEKLDRGVIARNEMTKQSHIFSNDKGIATLPMVARNDSNGITLQPNDVFYAKDLTETWKLIDEKLEPGDVLIIMGAGDIYKIADDMIKKER